MKTLTRLAALVLAALISASPAYAQGGLAEAILTLDNAPPGPVRDVVGRLFGALVDADIIDRNQNGADFESIDEVAFRLSRGLDSVTFPGGTRDQFEDWARDNAADILRILFPANVSSAVLGRDAAQLYAQQLLLMTVLNVDAVREPGTGRRHTSGGLVEFEWSGRDDERPGDSAWAWQWLYGINRFASVQARYAKQRDDLSTSAWAVALDYHPYLELQRAVTVRVGAIARTGFLYSHSASLTQSSRAIDLGTIDFGGGGWTSVRKDFRRARVGGGMLLQGSRSFVPLSGDDPELGFLADVINSRGISWDLAYGGTAGFDTTPSTSLIAKYLESHSVKDDERDPLRLLLVGYSFTLASGAAIDAGYKITASGGRRSGAIFLQGNFGW